MLQRVARVLRAFPEQSRAKSAPKTNLGQSVCCSDQRGPPCILAALGGRSHAFEYKPVSSMTKSVPEDSNQARIRAPMRNSATAINQSATTDAYMLIGRPHFWTLRRV